ncbi:glycosyltransferase family 2 protein [Epilithonimonas zeae]|uniref:glycosyltransferase family 2 protein n=1 Tax=Epilithonimonas zeae TaxID=1416779 RepID=UPI00200FFA95|nr:glycosyltransferase family 2 protein [Epilithonimonas zeae]UQB67446.1 glycosyltransferase family 2 protein [Epilithonimonas zeae]
MKTVTIFTPTYNRAHLLTRLYNSLLNQTNQDFVWLIIDDGSTDNTKSLVEDWQSEKRIEILYHFKQNGGMHTGHNKAYELINTELNVCIDSDDYMPNDAIAKIVTFWNTTVDKDKIAGIVGLDATENGDVIGTKIPEYLKKGSLSDLYRKHHVTGDKKVVLRTDIVKKYPAYPEYENEKLVPLGILYLIIGKDYDFLYSNNIYCIVEYQENGSSNTILKQYRQSPKGFAYSRLIRLKYIDDWKINLKDAMHLVSSTMFMKDWKFLLKSEKKIITLLSIPFGIALNLYIKTRLKDN